MDNQNNDQWDKRERKEFEENPMVNLGQSINNAEFGYMRTFSQIGCLPSIILIVVILILYWILR
jgi:ABC-type dipeptide/oligopeptide/nickel transport system permease subunit